MASSHGNLTRLQEDPRVATTVLANGLRVIVAEHRRSPVAVCHATVRVGSNWEPDHLRGWSHGIEHMLFKGTERRGESDFAREVAAGGGVSNAGTGYETTGYHITVPVAGLPAACDLLADALYCSRFDAAALDAERQVLVHENHMYDDVPFGFGITWRWALELALDRSPYRHPIGGHDEALLETPRDEIIAFYRQTYRPDNTTVVVVGDIGAERARDLVASTFGSAPRPAEPLALAVPPVEPERRELRYRVAHGDIKRAYAKFVTPAPSDRDKNRPALSVLRRLLTDGRSCRLYRRVQEERQLVSAITAATETGPREGLVVIDLETDPERLGPALLATAEVLESLKVTDQPATELERARTRARRSHHFGAETVQGLAARLAHHDAIDDLSGAFTFPNRVAAVQAADVAHLARRTFDRDRLACLVYLPDATAPTTVDLPESATEFAARLEGTLSRSDPESRARQGATPAAEFRTETAIPTARPSSGRTGASAFEFVTLAGGLRVHYRVDRAEPIWAVALLVPGGATGEDALHAGRSVLAQQVQIKGTAGVSAAVLHDRIEALGATLSPHADRDHTGLLMTGLSETRQRALALLGDCVVRPEFAPDEVERERRLAREQLASLADDPLRAAALEMRDLLYGDHPYGRPLVGTETSLARLVRDDLLAWHGESWRAGALQIAIAGDLDPETDWSRLEAALADLPGGVAAPCPQLAPARRPDGVVERRIQRDQHQCVLLTGWPGAPNPQTDRVPLLVLRELLNGQSGRLFTELRNRRSLCYNAGFVGTAGCGEGFLAAFVLTAPESESAARKALLEVLRDLASHRVPAAELDRARAELTGNLLIGNQANLSRAARCARDLLLDRGADDLPRLVEAIRTCSAEDVRDATARYVKPDERFEVVGSPVA